MGRPIKSPTWATDTNFTGGVDVGQPTRVDPGAGYRAQGFQAGETVPAAVLNDQLGRVGDWLTYLRDIDWLNLRTINAPLHSPSSFTANSYPVAMGFDGRGIAPPSAESLCLVASQGEVFASWDGVSWVKKTVPSFGASDHPKSVFYSVAAGCWIVGGASTGTNKILNATTAHSTWFAATDPGTNLNRRGIADNGSSIVVMVKGDAVTSGEIISSPNAIAWTVRLTSTKALYGVAYGAGVFVAVGFDALNPGCYTSPDGVTWTNRSTAFPGGERLFDVTFDSVLGLFCAVGSSGVYTSPDGVAWTARTPAAFAGNWLCVVSDGAGVFYAQDQALGPIKNLWRSTDGGLTWQCQQFASPDTTGILYALGRLIAYGIVNTTDKFGVALGIRTSL